MAVHAPVRYVSRAHARWLAADPGGGAWAGVDGTLLLADISGFTALSEKLARRGHVGAEELTDIVNTVVGSLLAVAWPWGGDLLKYGGDALLLLFADEEHEVRAAAAAGAMQNVLRGFRNLQSESGRISLRMSIGLESGHIDLFLAGDDHRELLVAGPSASRVVQIEKLAQAGDVALGPVIAAALPSRTKGAELADGVVKLRSAPMARVSAVYDAEPTAATVNGIPVALRSSLGSPDGEHRQAAVAFIRAHGLDELCSDKGPKAGADALHALVSSAQRACATHGVTFLGSDVDNGSVKLILAAGAPTTFADDEGRIVAALRDVLDSPSSLTLRAGVHRGRLFAVEVGDHRRQVYTVLGDTVNTAARVMVRAPDGELLATSEIAKRIKAPYVRTPMEPFNVKGKAAPVDAVIIGPAPHHRTADTGPGLAPTDGPFVGRESELEILTDAIHRSATEGLQIVEIVGESGIGKSRLLAEACTAATDSQTVMVVHGRQYAAVEAYRAIREPLRILLGVRIYEESETLAEALRTEVRRLTPELEPMLPLLGVPFGLTLPDTPETATLAQDYRQEQIHLVTLRFLDAFLPPSGVLVIEDAYWLDDGSGRLLSRVIRTMSRRRWAVLAARRPPATTLDLSNLDVFRIALAPLPKEAALRLAERVGAGGDAQAVVERSGGNPLFLKEIAAASAGGHSVDELPDNVEAVIAAHIDTLHARHREVVRIASVLGTHFSTMHLTEMLESMGDLDLERDMSALQGVIERDGPERMRFAHGLLREAAYAGLAFKRRRRLHGRAADLLVARTTEPERFAAVLSLHYHAAARHADCWHWSQVAAELARKTAAPVEAVALLGRAIDSGRAAGVPPEEFANAYVRLGDVAELAGRYDQAIDAYKRARRLLSEDHVAVADLYRKQGHVIEHSGKYTAALQCFARGFRALGTDQARPAKRAKVELTLASGAARLRQGKYKEAARLLREAVTDAELIAHKPALARACYLLDWALTDIGEPDHRYRELALPIYQELDDFEGQANVYNNLGVDAYYEGRWDDALDFYRLSREAVERVGNTVLGALATNNIGEILSDQGYLPEARQEFKSALEVFEFSGYVMGIGGAIANLGRLAARLARFEESKAMLRKGMDIFESIGADALLVDAECRELERLVLMGEADEALAMAERTMAKADQPHQRANLERVMGVAYLQKGLIGRGRETLENALGTAIAAGAEYEEARTRAALGKLVRTAEKNGRDPIADEIFARLGVIWLPIEARLPGKGSPLATPEGARDAGGS